MLETLLRNLDHREEAVREAAIRQARSLPPDQLRELIALEAKQYQRYLRGMTAASLCIGLASLLACYVLTAFFALSAVGVYIGCWMFVAANSPTRARYSLAQVFEEVEEPAFVGHALSLLGQLQDDLLRKSVVSCVRKLLPRLRADQINLLTGEQKQILFHLLQKPFENIALTLAILKALEQIGDEDCVPLVAELANAEPAPGYDGGETYVLWGKAYFAQSLEAKRNVRRVCDAANQCLDFLHLNSEQREQARHLLRAAASPAARPEELLRPAVDIGATPPEQLLRPQMPQG